MVFMVLGKEISSSAVQFLNTLSFIEVTPFEMVTLLSEVQSANAHLTMFFTLLGRLIVASDVQS
jgi:hypothetical protein